MNRTYISLTIVMALLATTAYAGGMHGGGHMMNMDQHAQQMGHQSARDGQYHQEPYYDEDIMQHADTEHHGMTNSDGAYDTETMGHSGASHGMEDETHHMSGDAPMDLH